LEFPATSFMARANSVVERSGRQRRSGRYAAAF